MFQGASNFADKVDGVFLFILGTSLVFFIAIVFLIIFFSIRYHRSRNKIPADIDGNNLLEVIWTVIPTLIVLGMFYYGYDVFKYMRKVPKNARTVRVTARMWSWKFEYPGGIKSSRLVMEENQPYLLEIDSKDILHSLYIPAFRVKEDAVPGLKTYISVTPTSRGEYNIFCAEYCGLNHSKMLSKAVVVSAEQYANWIKKETAPAGLKEFSIEEKVALGKKVMKDHRCLSCHSISGRVVLAPSFRGLWGSRTAVIRGKKDMVITVDEEYVKRSLRDPRADIAKGFPPIMPLQELSDQEIGAVIEYLKTLKK